MTSSIAPIQDRLVEADVAGITIVWADNNGIPRSRTVPIAGQRAKLFEFGNGSFRIEGHETRC